MPERKVNTNNVSEIAKEIEHLNNKLSNELDACKTLFENDLRRLWTGEAAETTIKSFNTFYNKYAEEYKQDVNEYVNYLNTHVVELNNRIEEYNKQHGESINQ